MKFSRLTASFLRSFVLLIVIPILLVLAMALGIVRETMLKEATQRMVIAQESVAAALEIEIRDMELAMAHFLLVNQEQAFELASRYNTEKTSATRRSDYARQLTQLFNAMLLPRSNIVALHFYMKDGSFFCLKDELAIDISKITSAAWYQRALASPDHTLLDVSDGPVTYSAKQSNGDRPTLTVAYAPGPRHRYDSVEVACLYYHPNAMKQLSRYTTQDMGVMLLGDDQGNVLYDGSRGAQKWPSEILLAEQEQFTYRNGGQTLVCYVTPIQGTSLRIISAADEKVLMKGFAPAALMIVGIALFFFLLFGIFSVFFFNGILKPVNYMIGGMRKAREGDLSVRVAPSGKPEMQRLLSSFNEMMEQIQSLMLTVSREQEEKRLHEVKALQAQINPHFLFNALSSIRFIAQIAKFESISEMADALMQILHFAFKKEGSFYTVADELQVLKSYILLMKIRYSGSFEEEWLVDEEALACIIPRFTLQPIVENAIVHGFENKQDMGRLKVVVEVIDDKLLLCVEDNGQGMDEKAITQVLNDADTRDEQRYGIGIHNVARRIALNYGPQYGIAMESDNATYTRAIVTLPARFEEEIR